MKVAIASSGLGRVRRGIEASRAETLAGVLAKRGVDVTLFAGAGWQGNRVAGLQGCRVAEGQGAERGIIRCLARDDWRARWLARVTPAPLWRWGLKSAYGWEQFTFWRRLRPILQRLDVDVLHVQDPMLALWCTIDRRHGRLRTRAILAHGTEEPPEFLDRVDHVQHLAPWHKEQLDVFRKDHGCPPARDFAIPNCVDLTKFAPVGQDRRRELRRQRGIPENARVVGAVAAVKATHKRIDYLVREFAGFVEGLPPAERAVWRLVVAGAKDRESSEVIRLAGQLAPGHVTFLLDVPHDDMPQVYNLFDLFILPSLFEMMPIAVIEAMACGVPVMLNRHPVLEWMGGATGVYVDMQPSGSLANAIARYAASGAEGETGSALRERAGCLFSEEKVIGQVIGMYEQVLAG